MHTILFRISEPLAAVDLYATLWTFQTAHIKRATPIIRFMANMATSLLGTTESVPGASIPVEFVQQPSESYRSAPSTPQKSTPQTNTVTIAYTPTPTPQQLQQQQPGATPLNNANLGSSLQTDPQSLHRGVADVATSRDASQQHSVGALAEDKIKSSYIRIYSECCDFAPIC